MFDTKRFEDLVFFRCYQIIFRYDDISPVDHSLRWGDTFYVGFDSEPGFDGIIFQVWVDIIV